MDMNPYLDDAIGMLSESTAFLYDDEAPWAVRVLEVKKGVDKVDAKVDEVKAEVAELKTDVAELKTDVAELKTDVAELKHSMRMMEVHSEFLENQMDSVKEDVDNVRSGVNNGVAIQLNSLRKWLDDPIEPVSAVDRTGDRPKYTVAEGFPYSVKDFWKLILNPTALTELARHYSVRDWDRWKRATSADTDVTCYMELQDAVTAHPLKCLRSLAMKWGLQYSILERPRTAQQEGPRKRKADTDNGSRRIRARQDQDNDSATGSESALSQDADDHGSQRNRVISVQMRVPAHPDERYDLIERIMAAAAAAEGPREYREPSEHTRLEWRVGSTPSTECRRLRRYHAQFEGERPEEPSQSATREVSSEEL